MTARIEDYALIGDTHTAALVGRDGSIDWLCLPRFDGGACFAALLGTPDNGRWLLAPSGSPKTVRRRYRDGTLVLETEFETDEGAVRVVDCMPIRDREPNVVRLVEGLRGRVQMRMELIVRFDFGSIVPWVRRADGGLTAIAGPDAVVLRTPLKTVGRNLTTVAEFSVGAGEQVPFTLTWYPSSQPLPESPEAATAIAETDAWWRAWSARCSFEGPHRDAVVRSLITLKALTYAPTGGIVAAPTTSLPERIGGVRNWDYRFCWVRDATLTLYALLLAGYEAEARDWRDWLLRAVAGHPSQLQILYGLGGERRIPELEAGWLPGYEGSTPVRIGNAAVEQFQLDVFGELMDALHVARRSGLEPERTAWNVERHLIGYLEEVWQTPDEGIWEVRGPRRHFTHSKVMAWVAVDRAVKAVERFGLPGPVERWRQVRAAIHDDVCARGYDPKRGTFVQSYGSGTVDASLLMIPLVGFLPATDERVKGTVAAIERELLVNGFVLRYAPDGSDAVDGLPAGEGTFLPCTFWLADNYAQQGRLEEAAAVFRRLLDIRNDVGLLAEEYDPHLGRQVGNFPQAFSHVGLVNTAANLDRGAERPAEHRIAG